MPTLAEPRSGQETMNSKVSSLPDIVIGDAVGPDVLGSYECQVHPDDVDSLVALVELADVADAHAIVRVRLGSDKWVLVEHRSEIGFEGVVLSRVDVTVREKARERAGRTEAYWRTILRNGHESIAVLDPDTLDIRHASDHLAELLGSHANDLIGRRGDWFVDQRDAKEYRDLIRRLSGAINGRAEMEIRLRRPGRDALWMQAVFSDARNDPDVGAIVVNLRDIQDRKRAEEQLKASESLFRTLLLHLADGAVVVDRTGRISFASERAAEVLRRPVSELVGEIVPLRRTESGFQLGGRMASGDQPPLHMLPAEVAGTGGRWFDVIPHDLSADPAVEGLVLIFRDITERRDRDERLLREVERDALTGLLNRRGFDSRISEHVDVGVEVRIGFLDLDGFKEVNDTHGHSVGDSLLRQVARRLEGCIRSQDEVARMGGDEFVVAFVGPHCSDDADLLSERVASAVSGNFSIDGTVVTVGVSVGWATVTPGSSVADALQTADERMYHDKRSRR